MPTTTYLVFSQQRDLVPDEPALVRNAHTFAKAQVLLATKGPSSAPSSSQRTQVAITWKNGSSATTFQLTLRFATPADHAAAVRAEAAGRAGGMSLLAKRCPVIYEVETHDKNEAEVLQLCALLASVALGPILPPDESTLLGVKSARERAEKLRA